MAKNKAAEKPKKIARQDRLPGMADAKITRIETLALDYAELRDERVALSAREVDLKGKLIEAMHKSGKEEYVRNGISIKLIVEKEGIKVKIKASDDDVDVAVSKPETDPESSEAQSNVQPT